MFEEGLKITRFVSNKREFLAGIPLFDRADANLNWDLEDLPITRVLGLYWNANFVTNLALNEGTFDGTTLFTIRSDY